MNEIIELLKKDLVNEYSHMHFYLFASTVVKGLCRNEMSEFFADAAKSEMEHIREFSHVLLSYNIETPSQFIGVPYMKTDAKSLLEYAIKLEDEVVENYTLRIRQASNLDNSDGKFLEIFLENQLLDSKNDSIHMKQMLKENQ